jgi:hypothetical protein
VTVISCAPFTVFSKNIVFLHVIKGAPKLHNYQFVDRKRQVIPAANMKEEEDIINWMIQLAVAK